LGRALWSWLFGRREVDTENDPVLFELRHFRVGPESQPGVELVRLDVRVPGARPAAAEAQGAAMPEEGLDQPRGQAAALEGVVDSQEENEASGFVGRAGGKKPQPPEQPGRRAPAPDDHPGRGEKTFGAVRAGQGAVPGRGAPRAGDQSSDCPVPGEEAAEAGRVRMEHRGIKSLFQEAAP